jgi:hypothetical protein
MLSVEQEMEISGTELILQTNGQNTPGNTIVILTIYRAPTGNVNKFIKTLDSIIQKLFMEKKNIIIIGDFNIDFSKNSKINEYITNTMNTYNIKFSIFKPTRIDPFHKSASTIDNIATNIPRTKFKTSVIRNCLSDHFAISITITNSPNNKQTQTTTSFRRIIAARKTSKSLTNSWN